MKASLIAVVYTLRDWGNFLKNIRYLDIPV